MDSRLRRSPPADSVAQSCEGLRGNSRRAAIKLKQSVKTSAPSNVIREGSVESSFILYLCASARRGPEPTNAFGPGAAGGVSPATDRLNV
jgi:hypothetical protein